MLVILGTYKPDRLRSMEAYVELLQGQCMGYGREVTVWDPPVVLGRIMGSNSVLAKWFGYADKYLIAPVMLWFFLSKMKRQYAGRLFVHIADQAQAVYAPWIGSLPYLVTIHDCIAISRASGEWPDYPVSWTGKWQQRWIMHALKRIRQAVFVSEYSRSEYVRLSGRDEAACWPVIHNPLKGEWAPLNRIEARVRLRKNRLLLPDRFIMHHGNNAWYKNRDTVVETWMMLNRSHPGLGLVLSGALLDSRQRQLLVAGLDSGLIVETGTVDHEDLVALYCAAELLLFPSHIEGFGWPPLEAQACGCPVVASNAGALQEVLSKGALYADANDPRSLAGQANRLLNDPGLVQEMIRLGLKNSQRFDTSQSELAYDKLYQSCGFCD